MSHELRTPLNAIIVITSYSIHYTKLYDMRRGQSLVVWAIREGRQCARAVDEFLMGSSELPR